MPLYPQEISLLDKVKIKEYMPKEPPHFTATPFNIYVYKAHQVQYRTNTTLSETWARMQIFNKMNGFIGNYYIDHKCIWHIYPNCEKVIKVVICESSSEIFSIAANLIGSLMEKYQIPIDQVKFQFKDCSELGNILENLANTLTITPLPPPQDELFEFEDDPQKEPEFIPEVHANFSAAGLAPNNYLSTLQILVNTGELNYRIWMGEKWQPWVTQGETCGAEGGNIQGFQMQYTSDIYRLLYRCKLKNKGWLPWKDHSPIAPYKIPIQEIEFKIEVK